ncbi:DoxX family protein [Trinickia sp. YCB016]
MEPMILITAAAFLSAGIVNLVGPAIIRSEFAKWRYPDWFRVTIAVAELTGAVLLFFKNTQWLGAAMLLMITLGVLVSFARSKEWMRMQYPFVLFFLLTTILQHTHVLTG